MRLRSWFWIAAVVTGIAAPAHAAGERTFDRVTYTAPEGWKVEETGRGLVSISHQGADGYCLVAIYVSQPASGDLAASFSAEWKNVALQSIDPMPEPTHTVGEVGNTRAALGGGEATIKGVPATAVLVVLDAGASVVPIAILSSSTEAFAACNDAVKAMLAGLVVGPADTTPADATPGMDGDKLVVPPPPRSLTLTDLAGEWQHEDRISTTYVDRHTGAYAGSDNLAFRETWVIKVTGAISSH